MCAAAVVWLLLAVVAALGASEDEESRQIFLQFNPGFSSSSVNVLHTRAVGNGSTIHYIWSTIGAPTVLLLYTENEHSELRINWTKLLSVDPSGAITMDPADSVLYSTALSFTRIFEYKDVNNTANFSGTAERYFYPAYNLSNFVWENANNSLNSSSFSFRLSGVDASDPTGSFQNGSVSFKVSAYEKPGRDTSAPRLLHTANCTKLEFMISGVQPRGNHSRFALEMVTLEKSGHKKLRTVRSIDDEYTPTIFRVRGITSHQGRKLVRLGRHPAGSIMSPYASLMTYRLSSVHPQMMELVPDFPNASHAQGYFQWKSVAYGSVNGTRSNSLPCVVYDPQKKNGTRDVPLIIQAFYGEQLIDHYNMEALNVSFGIAEGDFYDKNMFLGWSALVGYGLPPRDSFSILVLCIMAVALGTPLLLLIVGAIVLFLKKNRIYSNYEPIN